MIPKQEVLELAKAQKIAPGIIEKDYVLGWVLAGINQHIALKEKWIFKGGTALKKCFFEEYRFSEDLDFTILNSNHINHDFLQTVFLEVLTWVYDQTGIEFAYSQTKFDIHPDAIKQYVTGSIYYSGPLRQRGSLNKIFLDILANELLIAPAYRANIFHPYSDAINTKFFAYCYSLEEIFAEKLRALAERARPRDLYDVIALFKNKLELVDNKIFFPLLQQKFQFKGIAIPKLNSIYNHSKFNELKNEWNNMLKHQVSELPEIEIFFDELVLFFNWLDVEILKYERF